MSLLTQQEMGLSQVNPEKQSAVTETKVETSHAEEEELQWVTGVRLYSIMATITLASFTIFLDTSIVATAVPKITSQFESLEDVGWYGAAYNLASAVMQPLAGKLYANLNTKWTFMSFLFVFEIGSLLCGVATSSAMLIVGRAVAGLGGGGIYIGALTIIALLAPMHKRAFFTGLLTGLAQLGLVCGPLIGGALTQYSTWRWCFYLSLPIGAVVAVVLLFISIPERVVKPKALAVLHDLPKKLDLIGFTLLAGATVQLMLGLQYGGSQYSWNSSMIIGLFCGFGATFLVLLSWFWYKKNDALIPITLLCKPTILCSSLVFGFFVARLITTSYYLPIYFQSVKGFSPTLSGVSLLPMIITQIFTVVISGVLVSIVGYYIPFMLASAILTSIGSGLLTTIVPSTSTGHWVGYLVLIGAGSGLGIQMPILAAQATVTPAQVPLALGLVQFISTLFAALNLSFSATILTNSLHRLIPVYAPQVDADAIIAAGAYGFRGDLQGAQLSEVLEAYAKSLGRVFYLVTAISALGGIVALGMGWPDMRKQKTVEAVQVKEEAAGEVVA